MLFKKFMATCHFPAIRMSKSLRVWPARSWIQFLPVFTTSSEQQEMVKKDTGRKILLGMEIPWFPSFTQVKLPCTNPWFCVILQTSTPFFMLLSSFTLTTSLFCKLGQNINKYLHPPLIIRAIMLKQKA
jgi:hypothetical protein